MANRQWSKLQFCSILALFGGSLLSFSCDEKVTEEKVIKKIEVFDKVFKQGQWERLLKSFFPDASIHTLDLGEDESRGAMLTRKEYINMWKYFFDEGRRAAFYRKKIRVEIAPDARSAQAFSLVYNLIDGQAQQQTFSFHRRGLSLRIQSLRIVAMTDGTRPLKDDLYIPEWEEQ